MWHNGFHSMLPQFFNSSGGKLSISMNFWQDSNFNSFCANNTGIYGKLKAFVAFGGDFGV